MILPALLLAAHVTAAHPVFTSYEQLFKFIASKEEPDLDPNDAHTIFQLASESCIEYVRDYLIVRADFLNPKSHFSVIRGAQGNGNYYVFRAAGGKFKFIGVMGGNSYVLTAVGVEQIGFDVRAHDSAYVTIKWHYDLIGDELVARRLPDEHR